MVEALEHVFAVGDIGWAIGLPSWTVESLRRSRRESNSTVGECAPTLECGCHGGGAGEWEGGGGDR